MSFIKRNKKSIKIAVICYHKNAEKIYQKRWIEQYRNCILLQRYYGFDIMECNYGGGDFRIFGGDDTFFFKEKSQTFVHCMNYLLNKCFNELGYDYVFNTNVDDLYSLDRISKQIDCLQDGNDLVASNFTLMNEKGKEYHRHSFQYLDIESELTKDHNIIGHSSVAYSKKFWGTGSKYNPAEIPYEDLKLWKRSVAKGDRIKILPEYLMYQRIHSNAVCRNENNR